MKTVHTVADLRALVGAWRANGERVAFVPTMGNLHAGHLHLVAEAKKLAERVVVSIFVNPAQFGAGEDFAAYPRTPEEDAARLLQGGTDLLFRPEVTEVYPGDLATMTYVEVHSFPMTCADITGPAIFVVWPRWCANYSTWYGPTWHCSVKRIFSSWRSSGAWWRT